jgi:hypothetical protein
MPTSSDPSSNLFAPATDVARVRDALIRELETITRYEQLAAQADSPDVRNFFLHLANEEKEHVAEAVMLMRQLDPVLEPHFGKPLDLTHFAKPEVAASPPALEDLRIPRDIAKMPYAMPAPPHPTAGQFSVGPLKRRAF